MSNEDTQVVDSAETTTDLEDNDSSYGEDDSTSEDETTSSEQDGEQSSTKNTSETPEQRLARLKRQYERELKKQGQESGKESHSKGDKEGQVDEKYLRLELKTEGVKSTKEQEVVLNYIKEKALLGQTVDVTTAMNSLVVREELEKIRRTESVPRPSSRTSGGASASIDYYISQIKKGNMRLADVPDRDMRKKISSTRGLF